MDTETLIKILKELSATPEEKNKIMLHKIIEILHHSGGSGGDGTVSPLLVTATAEEVADMATYVCDTSFAEINEAFLSGRPVIINLSNGDTTFNEIVIATTSGNTQAKSAGTKAVGNKYYSVTTSRGQWECDNDLETDYPRWWDESGELGQ